MAQSAALGRARLRRLFGVVLAWWLSIEPRNDCQWLPEVSRLATARVEGQRPIVANVWN